MRILNAADVQRSLPMSEAIEAMKDAYLALSLGFAETPLRTHLTISSYNAETILMPAHVKTHSSESFPC